MNKVGLSFGQQIVPVTSDKPISDHEKADLVEMKKVLDQKLGKDVVDFRLKDDKNIEIIVNDPSNPQREEYIANQLKQMAGSIHPATAPAKASVPIGPKAPASGKNLDIAG